MRLHPCRACAPQLPKKISEIEKFVTDEGLSHEVRQLQIRRQVEEGEDASSDLLTKKVITDPNMFGLGLKVDLVTRHHCNHRLILLIDWNRLLLDLQLV